MAAPPGALVRLRYDWTGDDPPVDGASFTASRAATPRAAPAGSSGARASGAARRRRLPAPAPPRAPATPQPTALALDRVRRVWRPVSGHPRQRGPRHLALQYRRRRRRGRLRGGRRCIWGEWGSGGVDISVVPPSADLSI